MILFSIPLVAACGEAPSPTPVAVSATPVFSPTATNLPDTPTPTPTITPQPTSSLGVKAVDLEGTTIEFWHPWSGATENAIQALLSEFNANNQYGITVEVKSQETLNSLYERIDSIPVETELPNLAMGANYQILSWISSGKPVVGLDTFVHDPEWGLSEQELADFNAQFLQQDVKQDSRFALPAVRSAQVLFYNISWAEELGFSSPPSTPEEFKEQACAAALAVRNTDDDSSPVYGGWLIDTSPSTILSWLYAYDSPILLPGGAGYQFDSPQSEAALLFLKELLDEGCAFEFPDSPAEVEFANRRALFITRPLTDFGYQEAEFSRADNEDEWTVLGFPSPGGETTTGVYGPSYLIFAGTPEENLATWLVIKWLLSPEQEARLIKSRGTFPVQKTTLDLLRDYASLHPQWLAAQDLLEGAIAEPGLESWKNVRWILGDVGTQVFRYYFTPDRIPATLELMDQTAAELHELNK